MATLVLCLTAALAGQQDAAPAKPDRATSRALRYLEREVPSWSTQNNCYSCHNNGDAARALYVAARLKFHVKRVALADTTAWLTQPEHWDKNGGDESFSDIQLARIQFAAALVEAVDAGFVRDKAALRQAAKLVAQKQEPDGSWKSGAAGTIGAPATYGTPLATVMARRILTKSGDPRFRNKIARTDRWLKSVRVARVLDAAAVLLGLQNVTDKGASAQREKCLAILKKGHGPDGGWGPYVIAPSEPFDTAIVLLALAGAKEIPGSTTMIRRGRAYLVKAQFEDGSWAETTRPANTDSYPHRMSTAGWATLALLATQPRPER